MIKFFRKIRQNLLSEGKTGKYMKYAIGEIILVVIGILIALQFNEWKVEKKNRQIEKTILKNIKRDLESDIQQFRGVKEFKKSQNEAGIRLVEYLIDDSKPIEDTIQFVNDIHLIIYFIVPSSNTTSYDIAVSTGYLNNITNDSLTNELSRYFNDISLEQHLTDTKRFSNAFNENHLMNNYPMFSKNVMPHNGQGGKYVLERYKDDKRPVLQPDDIRGDVSLENYLNQLNIRLNIGIIGLEKEEEWAFNLTQKIKKELNSIE